MVSRKSTGKGCGFDGRTDGISILDCRVKRLNFPQHAKTPDEKKKNRASPVPHRNKKIIDYFSIVN